jgi:hypothetical protein
MLTNHKGEKNMTELLRVVPIDSTEPVSFVCYHPIAEKYLMKKARGEESFFDDDEEMSKPTCLAVEYEYESVLHEICSALGWQGGTINQVVSEIKRLKEKDV